MSTLRDKMSCTVMYQPYAMSAYSTCDRPPPEKKSFRFPYVPSPPDSLHSDGSSYSSPGPSSGGTTASSGGPSSSATNSRRPMTPCHPPGGGGGHLVPGGGLITPSPGGGGGASSAPATITSSQHLQQQQQQQQRSPPNHLLSQPPRSHAHLPLGTLSSSNASSTSTSHTQVHEDEEDSSQEEHPNNLHMSSLHQLPPGGGAASSSIGSIASSSSSASSRAQYLSANCVVYEHYRGDAARVVEEHFTRALSASSYANEKGSKNEPMTARNFPPSFWNSNYQPAKPIMSYGPSDFYGGSVDYGLSHHTQGDPWHYPLTSHQPYHHRPSELPYPPMPSSSRFNAAQYGSFLLAGAAASTSTSRFHGMGGSGGCGVKGESPGGWTSGRYVHHDSISDLHLDYNYSAAAAAAYSNMTAGLETTVGQESSKGDAAYWF